MASLTNFGVPVEGVGGASIMMPKLQYRFRVVLSNFGTAGASANEITQNVISVTRPSVTHDEVTIDAYNSRAYLAGKHTWEPITITLRDDMNNKVSALVAAQLQKQLNHGLQAAPKAGSDYKFQIRVEQLDGNDPAGVIETWTLAGCFIQNANYNENNYATSDVMQITLQVRYDNADIHSGSADPAADGALSGVPLIDIAQPGTVTG